jgi:hypothetical protein
LQDPRRAGFLPSHISPFHSWPAQRACSCLRTASTNWKHRSSSFKMWLIKVSRCLLFLKRTPQFTIFWVGFTVIIWVVYDIALLTLSTFTMVNGGQWWSMTIGWFLFGSPLEPPQLIPWSWEDGPWKMTSKHAAWKFQLQRYHGESVNVQVSCGEKLATPIYPAMLNSAKCAPKVNCEPHKTIRSNSGSGFLVLHLKSVARNEFKILLRMPGPPSVAFELAPSAQSVW